MNSTVTQNLLVELLVEELPPKSLKQLGNSFAELIAAKLAGARPDRGRCGK